METALDPLGIVGVVAFGLTWTMAFLVLATGQGRSVNRHLAALLAAEGVAVLTSGLYLLLPAAPERYAVSVLHFMADAALPPLYLLFLSHALDLPWLRPFRAHAGHLALGALSVAGPLVVLAAPDRLLRPDGAMGPWLPWHLSYVALGFALGLAAAVAAYRTSRTPTLRARSCLYLLAFGVFDVVWGFTYVMAALVATGVAPPTLQRETALAYALATPVFVGLLAYGILRAQLFDIDVRVKVGIRRGTVALAFLIVFIAAAEVAQGFLSQEYGLAVGGLAAGLLILAIRPIERAAERLSQAAMPHVDAGSPEYVAYKKLEVYRAAVESALESGYSIDERERATLDRLRAKLGIRAEDALLVERDASAA